MSEEERLLREILALQREMREELRQMRTEFSRRGEDCAARGSARRTEPEKPRDDLAGLVEMITERNRRADGSAPAARKRKGSER